MFFVSGGFGIADDDAIRPCWLDVVLGGKVKWRVSGALLVRQRGGSHVESRGH